MQLLKNVGDAFKATNSLFNDLTSNRLSSEDPTQFESIKRSYTIDTEAAVGSVGPVPGTRSIFNPWRVFRYSGFGLDQSNYRKDLHLDSSMNGVVADDIRRTQDFTLIKQADTTSRNKGKDESANSKEFKAFDITRSVIENPTASQIIEWSRNTAGQKQRNPGWGSPVPYASSDFLWCKYYGKVPNNRLVTLRRYPIPVEDDIPIDPDVSPLVPLAQAVTWYGKDLDNDLNKIMPMSWGLNWTPKSGMVQDVTGNEIRIDEVLDTIGGLDEKTKGYARDLFLSGSQNIDLHKISGFDAMLQNYIKQAWGNDGPYWNRVLGPVNVVEKTLIRDRGFKDQQDMTLVFDYSLRSFGGINPKIAFLDLLSNFLSLTYNTAPFWGGASRYFQRTGVTIPGLSMNDFLLKGDMLGMLNHGLKEMAALANQNIQNLKDTASTIGKTLKGIDSEDIPEEYEVNTAEKLMASKLKDLIQKPLMFRAIMDGRAVGEWHVTVGNPMNPIAMIGNLCLDSVSCDIGETLGIDDFPTEFKFTVKLKHGRPRAKQDIESMFNLGNGAMGWSELAQPSSAFNSYGDRNTFKQTEKAPRERDENGNIKTDTSAVGAANIKTDEQNTLNAEKSSRYASRVVDMYGSEFISPEHKNIQSYFTELKTID